MKSVCVFCGSSSGKDPIYLQYAQELGKILAARQIKLIYGGAAVGIMGALADAVLEAGGSVVGVIPGFLSSKEIRHDHLTELITVDSMHERKQKMAELSQGFIALPGGFGTLEELCEILTWSQLGLIRWPVGILNANGYYESLWSLFSHMVDQEFLKEANRQQVIMENECESLLAAMDRYVPLDIPKWLDLSKT